MYYQSNCLKQHSTEWWEVVKYTHVLQFSLERGNLSTEG